MNRRTIIASALAAPFAWLGRALGICRNKGRTLKPRSPLECENSWETNFVPMIRRLPDGSVERTVFKHFRRYESGRLECEAVDTVQIFGGVDDWRLDVDDKACHSRRLARHLITSWGSHPEASKFSQHWVFTWLRPNDELQPAKEIVDSYGRSELTAQEWVE